MFRDEVLRGWNRLAGEITLASPLSWRIVTLALALSVGLGCAFLFAGSYARVETVTGVAAADGGTAVILPTRSGTIASLSVREGQIVAARAPLAEVRAEEALAGGTTAPQRILDALTEQDARLVSQKRAIQAAADAERARLLAQTIGHDAELASFAQQLAEQKRLVEAAATELTQFQTLAERGFASRRDVQRREEALILRRQQLAALNAQRATAASAQAQSRRALVQVSAQADAQVSALASERATVAGRVAEATAARGYTLTAPVAGTITALTARVGQPALPLQPLMTIVPEGTRLEAQLLVPTHAVGFVHAGQPVRLAIDAFPYQRFGTIEGRVRHVSAAAVARASTGGGPQQPMFLVTVDMPRPWITAFGRRHPLMPDMTLTARIVTEERSLFEWLFEPVLAVRNR